jgi:CHAT domain-containing protein
VNERENHLNPERIGWLIDDKPTDSGDQVTGDLASARQHLAECASCQRLLHMYERAGRDLQALRNECVIFRTRECPEDSLIWELASGTLTTERAETLLKHVVACDHCGPAFRQAITDLNTDLSQDEIRTIGQLNTSKPSYQSDLAHRLAYKQQLETQPTQRWFTNKRASRTWIVLQFALPVVIILAVAASWIYHTHKDIRPETLLAQAYAEQRTFELRIEGAPHAPLRQERGVARSALAKPAPLLRAEYEIRVGLAAKPEDAALLAAEGRAELLEWQYDEAIKSLRHSLDVNPNSSGVLSDLATAYTQRADKEHRPIDYGQALELLGQALQKDPENKTALFNRAVVEERMDLLEDAEKDWETYLRLDPHGDWTSEARQRLEALRQRKKASFAYPSPETDPLRAVLSLQRRADRKIRNPLWPDSLDEEYTDIAIEDWLPSFAGEWPTFAETPLRTPAWHALTVLAAILASEHHDNWLADVLSVRLSPRLLDGWTELALAVRNNSEGNFDSAARAAAQAEVLLKEDSPAAFLRALWEHAYALQRSQQGNSCLRVVEQAAESINTQRYPWIAAQFLLEHSICSAMLGQMGNTKSQVMAAASLAKSAGYSNLLLRTYHIMGIQAASQDPDVAWKWFLEGLDRHWAGPYRPFRIYQFCAEMSLTAENRGQWHLARALMEEAVNHITRSPNRLMEAVARHSLAVDTQLAGYPGEALENFRRAAELFSSLPLTPAVNALQFSTLVYQASLLSQQGHDESALQLLHVARGHFSAQSQYWIWLHYYQALGEALHRRGNDDDAEHALHAALRISESALATIGDEIDRSHWERQSMRAYRSLVELELERDHDPRRALEIWEWYVAAPIRIPESRSTKPNINFALLDSDPPLPRLNRVGMALPDLRGVTVISFAELRDGPVAWIFDDRGIEAARLKVSTEELNQASGRFARLCSDPSSNLEEIRQVGRQLYDWLLAPFESHLDPARVLAVETDGPLREVPFAALVTSQGQFLAESYALVSSPGLEYWPLLRRAPNFSRDDIVLAVGAPSGATNTKINMPFLPDSGAEAQNVSLTFLHSRLLLGSQATIEAVKRDLPAARVFHFAGHAVTSSTRSGLLFDPSSTLKGEEENERGFLDAQEVERLPLQRVDLVVLSACTTGGDDSESASPHGLVWAFLRARVPHVIASRWDIDSVSTKAFMQEFYKNLVTGRPPVTALRLASEVIRRRPETAHPYYWAAFSAFGLS